MRRGLGGSVPCDHVSLLPFAPNETKAPLLASERVDVKKGVGAPLLGPLPLRPVAMLAPEAQGRSCPLRTARQPRQSMGSNGLGTGVHGL